MAAEHNDTIDGTVEDCTMLVVAGSRLVAAFKSEEDAEEYVHDHCEKYQPDTHWRIVRA